MCDAQEAGTDRPVLQMADIYKSFDGGRAIAVRQASLEIRQRETFALVGESGSGKSTLARIAVGLIQPDKGAVTLLGHNLSTLKPKQLRHLRRDVQFIFQDPYSSLDPRQRIGSTLEEPLIVHGIKNSGERQKRVREILMKVGLASDVQNRFAHQFSGGQRQRIAIARALILEPQFIVCDEPVSALDVSVQAQVLNLLQRLREEFQLSMLFISHDLAVVAHIADRVGVMLRGSLVEVGTVSDIFMHPRHPYTRSLLAAVPGSNDKWATGAPAAASAEIGSVTPGVGCSYVGLCPHRVEACATERPRLLQRSMSRSLVACHAA